MGCCNSVDDESSNCKVDATFCSTFAFESSSSVFRTSRPKLTPAVSSGKCGKVEAIDLVGLVSIKAKRFWRRVEQLPVDERELLGRRVLQRLAVASDSKFLEQTAADAFNCLQHVDFLKSVVVYMAMDKPNDDKLRFARRLFHIHFKEQLAVFTTTEPSLKKEATGIELTAIKEVHTDSELTPSTEKRMGAGHKEDDNKTEDGFKDWAFLSQYVDCVLASFSEVFGADMALATHFSLHTLLTCVSAKLLQRADDAMERRLKHLVQMHVLCTNRRGAFHWKEDLAEIVDSNPLALEYMALFLSRKQRPAAARFVRDWSKWPTIGSHKAVRIWQAAYCGDAEGDEDANDAGSVLPLDVRKSICKLVADLKRDGSVQRESEVHALLSLLWTAILRENAGMWTSFKSSFLL